MKRRHALGAAALGITTSVLTSCAGGQRSRPAVESDSDLPQIRWRMATSWPVSLDTIFGGAAMVCERVRLLSSGRFDIRPYAAGELVPGLEVLDAVQSGSVQCGHTAAYYYVGKNPAFAFATSVPFGLDAQQQNAWLYEGGGNAAVDRLFADFGARAFPAGNTGTQMGGWFKRQIDSPADLQGLKMRIPGLGGKVMAALGVNVQVLPGGEIFLALERGAIDAAEWTGPYDDEKLGLNRAADFYYHPGWWEPGPTVHALVNEEQWAALPKIYQDMFSSACHQANLRMLCRYEALNGTTLTRLLAGGTQLMTYSDEILQAARDASFQLYADSARGDADFRRLFEQWRGFRAELMAWNRTVYPLTRFLHQSEVS